MNLLTRSLLGLSLLAFSTVVPSIVSAQTIFATGPNPFPNGSGLRLHGALPHQVTDVYMTDIEFVDAGTNSSGAFYEDLTTTSSVIVTDSLGNTSTPFLPYTTSIEVTIGDGYNPFTNPTGTFSEVVNTLSAEYYTSSGTDFQGELNPDTPSVGSVTIASTTGGFNITNSLDIYVQMSINDGAFNALPVQHGTSLPVGFTTPTPEPTSAAMGIVALAVGGLFLQRRRTSSKA